MLGVSRLPLVLRLFAGGAAGKARVVTSDGFGWLYQPPPLADPCRLRAQVEDCYAILRLAHGRLRQNSCSSFLAISSMFSGGQPEISMPSRRPIWLSTSLISFKDLRPKFGVRSISLSVFWTRSPM